MHFAFSVIWLFIACSADASAPPAGRKVRIISVDSAAIVSPPAPAILKDSAVVFTIVPKCRVTGAYLYVTRYPSFTDTIARLTAAPFTATWHLDDIADQDQLSLHFGYTLFHINGDTVVSPPLVHRWCVDRHPVRSVKRVRCRELSPGRSITVDGKGDDWNGIRRYSIGPDASFACTWNAVSFYLIADVGDERVTSADRVEACFDLYSTRTVFSDSMHRIITFCPVGRSIAIAAAPSASGPRILDSLIVRISEEAQWQPGIRPNGYTVEARIPFCVLSAMPFPPSLFGFDIAIVSDSSGGELNSAVTAWSGAIPSARRSPARWGAIILGQTMPVLKITLISLAAIVIAILCIVFAAAANQKRREMYYGRLSRQSLSPKARSVIGNIESHCCEPDLSMEKTALQTGISIEELNSIVKNELGASYTGLLEFSRICMAKRILVESDFTADDIGTKCGFGSGHEFETAFCRITGTTPGKFREHRAALELDEEQD